jgi:Xaa-Pro dipeptidase
MTYDRERNMRLRQSLAAAGLDAALAYRVEEVVLTTGECPHLGVTLCLFPRVGAGITYTMTSETPDLVPAHMEKRLYTNRDHLRDLIAADLAALNVERAAYSVEMGTHALPGNVAECPPFTTAQIAALLGVHGVPGEFFIPELMHKTEYDIQKLLLTNQIAALGIRRFFELLQPGRTEAEIAAEIEAVIHAQTGKLGCKLARGWACVQAAHNTFNAGGASRSSGYVIQDGDIVLLELGTMVDGYYSDLTRTRVVGTPSAAQTALMNAARTAQRAALDTIRAGVTCGEVDAAAHAAMDASGFGEGFKHNTGHHVGFRYHDYGSPLSPSSTALLEVGNVITVEPGTYGAQYGGGCRYEDNVAVTADGFRFLSPYELI